MGIKVSLVAASGIHAAVSTERAELVFMQYPSLDELRAVVEADYDSKFVDLVDQIEVDNLADYKEQFEDDETISFDCFEHTGAGTGVIVFEKIAVY